MNTPSIKIKNVTVFSKINFDRRFISKKKHQDKKIIDSLSLEVKYGEAIGIIGSNGSGKSSLLRLIAGIYEPDSGNININGKVLAYLGGTMFEYSMSGEQFIRHTLEMYGKSKDWIIKSLPEIYKFIEFDKKTLNKNIDQYSDGMKARLSFACMIFTKPDILLIDEIIGTGDQFFIEKASKFLHNYINEIPIVLITSHDMEIIKNFCKKTILLKEGKIHKYGKSNEIIKYYQKLKE